MLGEIALVLLGAILGWGMSLYGFRVSEMANLIDDHINDLAKYSEELRQHWSKSFIDDKKLQMQEIILIKSLYVSILSFYSYHASQLFSSTTLDEYDKLYKELVDSTTSEEFESIGRDFNEAKAVEIQKTSWELIQVLRRERREQYRLVSPFRMLIRGVRRHDNKK